ncbi:MAG: ribonuclease Z [Magnetococcales bacterium]|nr:ribonuclease Z [Magnetococcales bacterium]
MKLTILGSGTGLPHRSRNAPGYFLEGAGGGRLLVDAGSGTLGQMARAGKDWAALDGVCITHTHPDHISDLVALLHAFRLPGLVRDQPLVLLGPPGFEVFCDRYVIPVSGLPGRFPVTVTRAAECQELAGLTIRTAPTRHSERLASLAYRFEEQGRSLLVSGDCDDSAPLRELARGVDLAVLEASTLAAGKVPGHLSAEDCGRIAHGAGVGRLVLSHFYPIAGPDLWRLAECGLHYSGDARLAEDFMELDLEQGRGRGDPEGE